MKNGTSELRSKSGKGWLAPSKSTKHASSASSATASAVGWQLKIRGGSYACCNIIKMTFPKKCWIDSNKDKRRNPSGRLSLRNLWLGLWFEYTSASCTEKNTTHHLQLTQLQKVPKPGVLFVQARCQSTTRGSSDHQEVQLGTTSLGSNPSTQKWKNTMQLQGTGCLPTKSIVADSTHLGFRSCSPQLRTSNPLFIQIQQAISALTWLPEISEQQCCDKSTFRSYPRHLHNMNICSRFFSPTRTFSK